MATFHFGRGTVLVNGEPISSAPIETRDEASPFLESAIRDILPLAQASMERDIARLTAPQTQPLTLETLIQARDRMIAETGTRRPSNYVLVNRPGREWMTEAQADAQDRIERYAAIWRADNPQPKREPVLVGQRRRRVFAGDEE